MLYNSHSSLFTSIGTIGYVAYYLMAWWNYDWQSSKLDVKAQSSITCGPPHKTFPTLCQKLGTTHCFHFVGPTMGRVGCPERLSARVSKIKNDGLDQYGAEPFEQQQFGTASVEGVNVHIWIEDNAFSTTDHARYFLEIRNNGSCRSFRGWSLGRGCAPSLPRNFFNFLNDKKLS